MVKGFVLSSSYQALCLIICQKIPIKRVPDYSDVMASLDMKRLLNASLSLQELEDVLLSHQDELIRFSINKFKKMHHVPETEDYPPGEEVEEKPAVVDVIGYSQGFLLMNLIEFILTKKGINELKAYFKKSRIPQADQYAIEVMSFLI